MAAILNAAPKAILQGIKDESGGILPIVPEMIPTHLPHIFLFTEWGDLEPQLVSGAAATRNFGAKSFDVRSKYANHQTVLANVVNGNGNSMVIQRLKPADAPGPATLTLSLEIVATEVPQYDRHPDGSLMLDSDGEKVPTGDTLPGYKARWIIGRNTDIQKYGERVKMAGELTGTGGVQSQIYPIMDLEVSSFGEHGNLKGIRLWAPTMRGTQPASEDVILDNNAYLYRIQMIQKPDAKTQPNIVQTIAGSQNVEFSFKEGAMNRAVDAELNIESILLDRYRNLDVMPKQWGPFNNLHVYKDFLAEALTMVYESELAYQSDWPTDVETGMHMVNLIGGQNLAGNDYYTLELLGRADGGVEFTPNSNHYASGGGDGTMDFETFDDLVANQCANYGDLEYSFMDMAYWPQSTIWDTGFTIETKKKLLVPMGRRKDMYVVLSTQDVSRRQNTAEEETSMAIALRAAARVYPESEIFGTPVCRAAVIGHSGNLINHQYTGLLPLTIELADKVSKFMGAGNGIWKSNEGFDMSPYNQVNMFKNVNCVYKPQTVYDADWNNGLTWVQNYDRRKLFFPAVQTVYDNSTSVINSFINMAILVECEKVAHRVWRDLTGGAKLTREQFIERSNQLISERLDGRFDDRVIIQPNTYFTDVDAALGYAWSCDIIVYMNNMMTVGTYTIIARRRADFE